MKKLPAQDRKLAIRKDTVRMLDHVDLTKAAGGALPETRRSCSYAC